MKSVYRIVVLACSVVFTAAGVSLGALTLGPPDFALERTWNMMKIALVRVVRVEDGEVVLRTERSVHGRKRHAGRIGSTFPHVVWLRAARGIRRAR